MEKHLVRKQQISVFRLEFCSHRSSISMQLRTLYFFLALTFLHTQFMPSFRQRKVMLVKRREKESPNPTRPPFCKHRVLPPHLPPACPLHPKMPWVKKQVLHCSVDVVTQRLLNLSSDHKKVSSSHHVAMHRSFEEGSLCSQGTSVADEGSVPGLATDDLCNLRQVILSLRVWILGGCLLYRQLPIKNTALILCSAASLEIQIHESHCNNWI